MRFKARRFTNTPRPDVLNVGQQARMAWKVTNQDDETADIDIFDVIGDPWFGTMASDFVKELRDITAPKINLHINSPGGYVNDGLAMYAAIQQHPSEITSLIESEASSAASWVALAADSVKIFKNAKMFIHDARGLGIGNAADMRLLADMLDEESENIAGIYADKAGGTVKSWREAMQANDGIGTSYRGNEAVDAGLADEVVDKPVKKMPMQPMHDDRRNQRDPDPEQEPQEEDELDELLLAQMPALADSAGYKPPVPDLTGMLEKRPLEVGGQGSK